jgi:hypothetical protein
MKFHPLRWLGLVALVGAVLGFGAGCSTTTHKPGLDNIPIVHVPTERPGIGTGLGENRESWIEPTYFARSSDDRPSAAQRLLYNDREGYDATMKYLGGDPRSCAGLQPVADGLIRAGLRDGDGHWFDTSDLRHQRYVVGQKNARYEIVIRNETRRRLEVVVSVDGKDVLDGEKASFKKRGHVLDPRETMAIEGFRKSPGEVAAFRFTSMNETYSQRFYGETKSVGAIGLAVFSERWLGTPVKSQRPQDKASRPTKPKPVEPNGGPTTELPDV